MNEKEEPRRRRRVLVIGIGAGNPDFVTIQAVKAMNEVDVFFIPDKGAEKAALSALRREVIERHVGGRPHRVARYDVPRRRAGGDYEASVADWHDAVEAVYGRLILDELGDGETGAFLVWGDPTLYDSTLRILDRLGSRGMALDCEVIPGISSVQALAAAHRTALNAIGRSILITNGRAQAEPLPDGVDSVVVLLNADKALGGADGDLDIYWGANLGMEDEALVSGKRRDVADEIGRVRDAIRRDRGWIMDSVLIKRPVED